MDILFLEFHLHSCGLAVEGMKPHTSQRIFKSRTESTVGGSPSMVMAVTCGRVLLGRHSQLTAKGESGEEGAGGGSSGLS